MTEPARKLSLVKGGGGPESEPPKAPGPEDDVQLTLMDHLRDLRDRIKYSVYALILSFGLTYALSGKLLTWILGPVREIVERNHGTLAMTHPTEGFFVFMRVAGYGAVFVASPFILYQLYLFIAPGLYRRERRLMVPFVSIGLFLFLIGGIFAWKLILPFALEVLVGQYAGPASELKIPPILDLEETVDFCLMVIVAFGIIFEMPLIISLLARVGLVTPAFLRKYRRHAIVLNVFIAAVVTPTGDAVNLALMAVPLTVFYEVGIWGAVIMERQRGKSEGLRIKDDDEDSDERP
jgi:sec-independent protein translocase protein TatC